MVAVAGIAVLATLAVAQTHPATYTLNDVMQMPGIVLPIEPTTAGIFITVTVNGKQAHLLLDTGAARTIVDNRYAKKAAEIDRVIVNEQGRVQSASIKQVELSLGTLKLAQWKSVVLDTAPASSRAGVRIDGFLGLDILSRFRFFQLDARERTLTLTP